MCTFSLATSIGSALLLPFSIITNEVLLLYLDNYYMQWLNDSLIKGLWNYVFLFSNISLFVLLPFAYFFPESEGFSTSRGGGLASRIYETLVLLLLFSVLISGLTYVICSILGYTEMALTNLLYMNNHLPLLYSCVSFLGVLLLLVCTPIGIAKLFGVLGELIMKPRFLRNIQEEYEVTVLEEMHLARKFRNIKDEINSPFKPPMPFTPTFPASPKIFPWSPSNYKSQSVPSLTECGYDQIERSSVLTSSAANTDLFDRYNLQVPSWVSPHHPSPYSSPLSPLKNGSKLNLLHSIEEDLHHIMVKRKELENQKRASAFRRNFGYPIAMMILLALTAFAGLLVVQNTLELLVGLKALPSSSAQTFVVGITSLSKMGIFGAFLEIILILYLWCASIVGLYSLPGIRRIRPKTGETTFNQCVTNCALLLILSTALPVLARTVGITNFDLLGSFGQIKWLKEFWVVFSYNIVFAAATGLLLTDKFTLSVRKELYRRLEASLGCSLKWSWRKSLSVINDSSLEEKNK